MSITSSIDFNLVNNSKNTSSTKLISILKSQGWEFDLEGKKEYLPVDDNDEYNWQCEELKDDLFWGILKEKEQKEEIIGIVMTWETSEIGGSFHFWSHNSFSININLNRKLTSEGITDVNWYISKIIPLLKNFNITIESFIFSEYI